MCDVERIRRGFKPDSIATLFVGESAPKGGTFFYKGDSGLFREMRKAFKGGPDFLADFRKKNFYLDDLVLHPIDGLDRRKRREQCRNSVDSLSRRLKEYSPDAIVVIGHGIDKFIRTAAKSVGIKDEQIHGTVFPNWPKTKCGSKR